MKNILIFSLLILLPSFSLLAQPVQIDPEPFEDNSRHWYNIVDKSNVVNPLPNHPKYAPTEVKQIADNILLLQKNNGGWAKNYDVFAVFTEAQKDSLRADSVKADTNTTFDNQSTFTQINALAVAYQALNDEKYAKAALRGLDFILASQYENGGFPQFFPLRNNYSRHITYNDNAMIGVMVLLKAIADNDPLYSFVDKTRREKLKIAYEKGLDCVLKTQIFDNGKLTVWGQQHDEITLAPAGARRYELPSICNKESAALTLFLMSIDNPSPQIIKSIEAAVAWFEESKVYNLRVVRVSAPEVFTGYKISRTDRIAVVDSTAPPIWARFYELGTHRPLFCNRDGSRVYSLDEVARERRDGYGWYINDPQAVLNAYPEWKLRIKK
ncbi:MAG: pectate lyase [Prevotellaceae bacterium]|jgi:PelA/Pel-15E family pectate lyase|nr:pectate lyase [Prevotellaceae bacterium]